MKGVLPTFKPTQEGPSHKRQITYPLPKPQNWSAKAYNLFILKVPQWGYSRGKTKPTTPSFVGIIQDGGFG
jgi:hypothetical protein